jgi:hypothetical protein
MMGDRAKKRLWLAGTELEVRGTPALFAGQICKPQIVGHESAPSAANMENKSVKPPRKYHLQRFQTRTGQNAKRLFEFELGPGGVQMIDYPEVWGR